MTIIGIDPGATGAIAFYDTSLFTIRVIDMPVVMVKRGKRLVKEVAPSQLASLLSGRFDSLGYPELGHAWIEKVGAMPGQGVASMFAFGRSVGMVEGVLAGLGIPVSYVPSMTWVRTMQVRGGKGGSRLRASELFPENARYFARVMDHGRADAALIAMYGAKQ